MSQQFLLCDLSLAPEIGLALVEAGRRPEHPTRVPCATRAAFDEEVRNFPGALDAIGTMTDWLADMAGDVALIVGAQGGVYLTGALLDMIGDQFDADRFTQRYWDKGPRSDYVRKVPVFRTRASELELAGLATRYE